MSHNLKQVVDSSRTAERRLHPRWAPSSLVYVELGGSNGGVVLNIIEDGMALRAAQSLQGELLPHMRFRLPRCPNWIETSGQIVWMGKSEKEIGVRFIDLPDAARDQIKHWIASETSSGVPHETLENIDDAQAQRASEPSSPESTGWAPRSLEDAGVESRKRYKISSAIAAAAREGGTPASVSSVIATSGRSMSIAPRERAGEKRIAYPVSTAKAVTASPISEKRPLVVPASVSTPKSARDVRLNLSAYAADEEIGAEAPRRSWGTVAAVGSLIIIVSFAAGIAVGGRGLNGLIEFFQKLAPSTGVSTQPNTEADSTSASPAQRLRADEASDDSAPSALSERAPANSPADDSVIPSSHISTAESRTTNLGARANKALVPANGDRNAAKRNAKDQAAGPIPKPQVSASKPKEDNVPPPVTASNDNLSAAAQPQMSPLTAASASQQQGPPAVSSAPNKPELPTGSVAISSHFRSIRIPPELRSQISQLGNTLQVGELISSSEPPYPAESLQQHIEGTIRLHAVIGRDGTIQSVEPVSGPPLLMPAAINAVRGWRYKQTLLGGQPIERDEDITLVFRLKN